MDLSPTFTTGCYAMPGQKMRTGVVSVADETCAILAVSVVLFGLATTRR